MRKNKIIYIEGIPASGKSTLIESLSSKYNKDIDIIPEYINIDQGKKAEVSHDPDYFKKNDVIKWLMAAKSKKKLIFVDRGHLSTVIYNLAEFKISKKIESLKIIDWYFETILKNNYLPDYYVLLETKPAVSLKRRTKLMGLHNIWEHEDALGLANEYYIRLIRSYETKSKLLIIKTDFLSIDRIEQKIIEYFNL